MSVDTDRDTRAAAELELAAAIRGIAAAYPGRGRRQSLRAAARLRGALPSHRQFPTIGVVGTNGKTSTATYLARLLTASGSRVGLYTSPHLSNWTERVRVDDMGCDPHQLLEALTEVHEVARRDLAETGDLRFFDVLTLAAELLFARAGATVAVFEAGIGGRLDATRLLEPELVLLTNVAIDHAEILGGELGEILTEKLLVAPPGATVLSFPLAAELEALALRLAAAGGFRIAWLDPAQVELPPAGRSLPAFLGRSLALAAGGRRLAPAAAGAGAAGGDGTLAIDLGVPGRFERGERDGVPHLLDAAHNEAAWLELGAELGRRPPAMPAALVALVAFSPDKDRRGLAGALRSLPGLRAVIVTQHPQLPAADPEVVVADLQRDGLEAAAVEDAGVALGLAFERARAVGGGVIVFGSTHLAGEARRRLAAVS